MLWLSSNHKNATNIFFFHCGVRSSEAFQVIIIPSFVYTSVTDKGNSKEVLEHAQHEHDLIFKF